MRIIHAVSTLQVGGAEMLALRLAAAQREVGHDAEMLSFTDGPLRGACEELRVPVHVVEKREGFDTSMFPRMLRWLRQTRPHVVHSHNPQSLVYTAAPARLAGAVMVHTKHGNHLEDRGAMWLRRGLGLCVQAFVSVSDATQDFARQHFEALPSRMKVIENGVHLKSFENDEEQRSAARRELGLDGDTWVIGTVGRLDMVKNQSLLIRAAAPLLRDGAALVLVGDGPERTALEALASSLVCRNSTHFAGRRLDVPALLPAFDTFALSSHTEGLPLVVLEAMACGLPIVSTAVGGIPRVAVREETALLTAPGDEAALSAALATLRAEPNRAIAMGRAGRERVAKRYSLSATAEAYEQLYQELLT